MTVKRNHPGHWFKEAARWGLIILAAGLPFFRGGVTPEGRLFARLLCLFICGAWLSAMVTAKKPLLRRSGLEAPLGLFLLLGLLSGWLSACRHAAWSVLSDWSIYGAVFLLSLNLMRGSRWPRRLAAALTLAAGLLSLMGLLQLAGVLNKSWWSGPALSAAYVNRSHFAGLLVMLIPLGTGLALTVGNMGKRLFLFYLTGLMVIALFLTFSLGGWGALVASLLLMGWILEGRRGSGPHVFSGGVWCAIGSGVLFFVVAAVFWHPLAEVLPQGRAQGAWSGLTLRLRLWETSVKVLASRPLLGAGPGNFYLAAPPFRPPGLNYSLDYAHNDLLQGAAETGILGLTVLLTGTALFFRKSRRWLRNFKSPNWGVRWGALGGVVALLLHSLVDFQFYVLANGLVCCALAGLAVGGGRGYGVDR